MKKIIDMKNNAMDLREKSIDFDCRVCGCSFEAGYGDYKKFIHTKTINNNYYAVDSSGYISDCPICKTVIYKED